MSLTATPIETLPVGPRLQVARFTNLWIIGSPTALEPPLVAVIGTRDPDPAGESMARAIATALAGAKISVISGGALGIDAAAHAGALDAGGQTVVVLPSGFDHLYPVRHTILYETIVGRGGALLSPFPPETPPARWTFPRRNALLAALCDVLVVVQAPRASGSLITVEYAQRLGRRVLAVPSSPGDPRGAGCLRVLRAGAEVCERPEDVIAAVRNPNGPLLATAGAREALRQCTIGVQVSRAGTRGSSTRSQRDRVAAVAVPDVEPSPEAIGLDDESARTWNALGSTPTHLDALVDATGLTPAKLRVTLMTLVLSGLASDRGAGRYSRT